MLYRIAFFSSSKQLLQEAELLTILDQFSSTVDSFDIKGIFIYLNGSMLQIGEGESENFDLLLEALKSDPRQTYLTVLSKKDIKKRSFHQKYLFYKTLDSRNFSGLSEIITTIFPPHTSHDSSRDIIKIITEFFRNNYRN